MSDRVSGTITRAAATGVVLIGLVIAAYGVYLLVVGVTVVSVPAVPLGSPRGPETTETVPEIRGVIPAIAGGLILVGLALRRIWVAWIAAIAAAAFAAVFVFSIGSALVPAAALLFVLMGLLTWMRVSRASSSSIC